jgi:hypothetical protein
MNTIQWFRTMFDNPEAKAFRRKNLLALFKQTAFDRYWRTGDPARMKPKIEGAFSPESLVLLLGDFGIDVLPKSKDETFDLIVEHIRTVRNNRVAMQPAK